MMGSFFGFSNFGIITDPEVLDSFATCPVDDSVCPEVVVAPLPGADWTDGAGLVAGVAEDSQPHFSGLGQEMKRRCFQQQQTDLYDYNKCRKHKNTYLLPSLEAGAPRLRVSSDDV